MLLETLLMPVLVIAVIYWVLTLLELPAPFPLIFKVIAVLSVAGVLLRAMGVAFPF